jgi:hypothetical protein
MQKKNFSLYHKTYQLLKFLYKTVKNFPKEHKYSLGKDMLDLTWQCLDLAVEANTLPNEQKRKKIGELSSIFDKLKIRIRMAEEIDLLSIGQFAHLNEAYLLKIGCEVGGWLKWVEEENLKQIHNKRISKCA